MTKTYGLWKRLGALLLAFALIAGMCPVKASAAPAEEPLDFQLTLRRINWQKMWDDSEEIPSYWQSAILGERPETRPATTYVYIADVPNVTDKDAVAFYWTTSLDKDEHNEYNYGLEDKNDYIYGSNTGRLLHASDSQTAFCVKVVCDGLVLKNALAADTGDVIGSTVTWEGKTAWNEHLKYGVPVNVGEFVLDNVSGTESGNVNLSDIYSTTYIASIDGQYVPVAVTNTKTNLVTRKVYAGNNNGVLRFTESLAGTIEYPAYKPTFTIGGKDYEVDSTVYLAKDQGMTITVNNKMGAVKMPEVDGVTWTLKGDKWIGEMASAKSVVIGTEKIDVIVDTEAPVISSPVGYIKDGKAYIKFKVISASGVESVLLNEEPQGEAIITEPEKNVYTCELNGLSLTAGECKVSVKNKAGISSTTAIVKVAENLHFDFELVNAEKITESYVKVNGENAGVLVTLYGAEEGGVPSIDYIIEKDAENNANYVHGDTPGVWTRMYNLGTTGNTPGIILTAKDNEGRTAEYAVPSFKVDNTAPTYEITVKEGEGTASGITALETNKTTTVTVTVRDDVLMPAIEEDDYVSFVVDDHNDDTIDDNIKVAFKMNDNGEYVASYEMVGNSQTLSQIYATVSDAAGHSVTIDDETTIVVDKEAPAIEVTFSENVKGLKEFEGKLFAILDPVEDLKPAEDKDTETVTMFYSYEDLTGDTKDGKFTMDVAKASTNGVEFEIPATDRVGNYEEILTIKAGDTSYDLTYNAAEKAYVGTLYADRRIPGSTESGTPKVIFNAETPYKTGDTKAAKNLYKGEEIKFNVTITDTSAFGGDSGMASISWALEGTDYLGFEEGFEEKTMASNGVYNFSLKAKEQNEDADVRLKVTVKDQAGNGYHYSYSFAHDNLAPIVTVTKTGDGNFIDGKEYVKEGKEFYTVTINDLFLDNDNTKVTLYGEEIQPVNGEYLIPVVNNLKPDDIIITAIDKVKHTPKNMDAVHEEFALKDTEIKNINTIIYDTTAPVVTVTRSAEPVNSVKGGYDYFNIDKDPITNEEKPIKYSFEISDNYLSNVDGVKISYKMGKETTSLNLSHLTKAEGKDTYTYSFVHEDEDKKLSDIVIKVIDNAGNECVYTGIAGPMTFNEKGEYMGNPAIVDKTKPVVEIKRSAGPVKTVDGIAYYDKDVTYTVTVTEKNLNPDASKVTITGNIQGTNEKEYSFKDFENNVVEFKLTDPDQLENIQIQVIDYADHKPDGVTNSEKDMAFTGSGDYEWDKNTSKKVVVDKTPPTATLSITSTQNVLEQYVTHVKDGKEYYYLKLSDPAGNTSDNVEITATLTVKDRNLLKEKGFLVNNLSTDDNDDNKHQNWNLDSIAVNSEDSVATYTAKITVPYDSTDMLKLDLSIKDAVDQYLDSVEVAPVNNTVLLAGNPFQIAKEKVTSNIVMDRRRPSTENEKTPNIVIAAAEAPKYKTKDNIPLYNKIPQFYVDVKDSDVNVNNTVKDPEYNAGLEYVEIKLTHSDTYRGKPLEFYLKEDYSTGVYENDNKYVTFTENGDVIEGECNEYVLTVTAVDKVNNSIYQENMTAQDESMTIVSRVFAVDTMAPAVTVDYGDGPLPSNDKYFNEDRTAKITVEDINFNAVTTLIDTQVVDTYVEHSAWVHDDKNMVHETSCVYSADGDYTFSMSAKDLANNLTPDKIENYKGAGNKAYKEFTIDQTNPLMSVVFSPVHNKDIDGHLYYGDTTTATVTITEHNFRASDVISNFRKDNNKIDYVVLSDFASAADEHKAHAQFLDGNNYDCSFTYTDLAGNPAIPYDSPVFSVDTREPVIEITSGTMTNADGVLNVVSDDVVLQFKVNDEEKNLAGYTVKVTYLNNDFEIKEIVCKDGQQYPEWFTVDSQDDGNTIYINMTNILKEKANDGIYTVEVIAIDHSGNENQLNPPLAFSLNRFGSTFTTNDDYTKQFLKLGDDGITYHKSVDGKLIVCEINPNEVFHKIGETNIEGSMLTVVVNGVSHQLEKDKDYTVKKEAMKPEEAIQPWYVYTYEIDPSVFQDENGFVSGKYSILFYSEDQAGNKNSNEANENSTLQLNLEGEYTGKMEFVLDTMAPVITTTGIETNKVYNATAQRMDIIISDTTVTSIQVFLNGTEVALSETAKADDVAWLVYDAVADSYTLNVPEQNEIFGSQYVSVVALDAAGNASEALVEEFNISTSLLVRLFHNGWLVAGGVAAIAAVVFFILMQKKKKMG